MAQTAPAVNLLSLKHFPDVYVQVAINLYETGETKIGSLHIKPGKDAKNVSSANLTGPFGRTMNEVDWQSCF